jgi:hypothetical protein
MLILFNATRPMRSLFSAVFATYKNGFISHDCNNIISIVNCQGCLL